MSLTPVDRSTTTLGRRTLLDWLPVVVDRVATEFAPRRIIVFGSLARGHAGHDSDIDLLVEFDQVADKRGAAVALRLAVADVPAPIDFVVTDRDEIARRGSIIGPVLGTALHEGRVVYEDPDLMASRSSCRQEPTVDATR